MAEVAGEIGSVGGAGGDGGGALLSFSFGKKGGAAEICEIGVTTIRKPL